MTDFSIILEYYTNYYNLKFNEIENLFTSGDIHSILNSKNYKHLVNINYKVVDLVSDSLDENMALFKELIKHKLPNQTDYIFDNVETNEILCYDGEGNEVFLVKFCITSKIVTLFSENQIKDTINSTTKINLGFLTDKPNCQKAKFLRELIYNYRSNNGFAVE